MRFPPHILDEIRSRMPVSDVVGRRVSLRKQGREFIGLSPFNAEKTPSFTVNDNKGFYHCFSTGKHGDVFKFLMETEGVSFPEAVERLAGEAGVPLPKSDPRAQEQADQRDKLYHAMELACQFFEAQLRAQSGVSALHYVREKRGLGPETLKRFRIGFAPNSKSALREHLAQQGVSKADMEEAGLLIHGDDIPISYDRFRDRVMFPITDMKGRIIAFGGRAMSPDAPAKYLNSPQTPLFHKGRILFNGSTARQAAHDGKPVIVVEGYMDVIALSVAGFDGAVAPLGTALTEDQTALLWRWCDEPILCFDGDKAGMRAASRAIDLALPMLQPGKSVQFCMLSGGQDPDDLIRDQGAHAFQALLDGAQPLLEMLWAREMGLHDLTTPERRAKFEKAMMGHTGAIKDQTIQNHYRQALREKISALFRPQQYNQGGGRPYGSRSPRPTGQRSGGRASGGRGGFKQDMRSAMTRASAQTSKSHVVRDTKSGFSGREALIVAGVIAHPHFFENYPDECAALQFENQPLNALFCAAFDRMAAYPDTLAADLKAYLTAGAHRTILERVSSACPQTMYPWLDETDLNDAAAEAWLDVVALHKRQAALHTELLECERAFGMEPSDDNWARLIETKNALSVLSQAGQRDA